MQCLLRVCQNRELVLVSVGYTHMLCSQMTWADELNKKMKNENMKDEIYICVCSNNSFHVIQALFHS